MYKDAEVRRGRMREKTVEEELAGGAAGLAERNHPKTKKYQSQK